MGSLRPIKLYKNLKKKPHEYLKYYPDLVFQLRKKFRGEQPESSADSVVTDETHIIYYDSFRDYPIHLEGDVSIHTKQWAKAFMQYDLRCITRILCEGVFTSEELEQRCNKGLPYVKKAAVKRAAKWMMNKEQDPWSFTPGLWPTLEEEEIINHVLDTFNWVDPQKAYIEECVEMEGIFDSAIDFDLTPTSQIGISTNAMEVDDVDGSVINNLPRVGDLLCEDVDEMITDMVLCLDYQAYFNKVQALVKVGKRPPLGNTAQTARDLTQMTIPQNTDVFVDAVQFSRGRWAKAIQSDRIEDIANVLFRKYNKTDFSDKKFNTFDDFCTPKQLALIRAVAWIKQLKAKGWSDIYSFDSAISEHNLFLSPEEINRIHNYLTLKYGNGRSQPSSLYPTPSSSPKLGVPASPGTIPQFPSALHFAVENERLTCIVSPTPTRGGPSPTFNQNDIGIGPTSSGAKELVRIPTDVHGNVVINDYKFPASVWNTALRKFRVEDGPCKAGKYLFEECFTDDEIHNSNLRGRHGKQVFLPEKVNAILDALVYMRAITSKDPNKASLEPLTKSERQNLITKVFTEHSNYLRRKQKPIDRTVAGTSRLTLS